MLGSWVRFAFLLVGTLVVSVGVVACGGEGEAPTAAEAATDGDEAGIKPDPNLSVEQTVAAMKDIEGLQLLDVRTAKEWKAGHLPGAIHIPVQVLESRLGELQKDRPVLTYCAVGGRSARALKMLDENGFNTSGHLASGIKGWKKAGKEVVFP